MTTKVHRSVLDVVEFVGWPYLQDLVAKAEAVFGFREAVMLACLFTGGFRISEAVRSDHGGLKPQNVIAVEGKKMLRFKAVQVMKRYKKVPGTGHVCHDTGPHKGHAVWDAEHKHFETARRVGKEILRDAPVPFFEPFVPMIRKCVLEVPDGDYLFPFDRFKAYRLVEKLDPKIWPHWFRSQRASQLGADIEKGGYEWDNPKITKWFNWSSEETAKVYAHRNETEFLEGEFPDRVFGI